MDRAIHPAAAQKGLVGGVDDGIGFDLHDVTEDDLDRTHINRQDLHD
ncbi:MAG: hypothetical protein QME74_00010 [Candidatus Edwardsbacteria bacterium]|nr:hypothetical protein [Candidatus Edwardsbacteria bacterium]